MRVLVVDDDDFAYTLVLRCLHEHEVEHAASVDAAIARVEEGGIDLILLDISDSAYKRSEVRKKLEELGVRVVQISVILEQGIASKASAAIRSVVSQLSMEQCRASIDKAKCAVSELEITIRTRGKQEWTGS